MPGDEARGLVCSHVYSLVLVRQLVEEDSKVSFATVTYVFLRHASDAYHNIMLRPFYLRRRLWAWFEIRRAGHERARTRARQYNDIANCANKW